MSDEPPPDSELEQLRARVRQQAEAMEIEPVERLSARELLRRIFADDDKEQVGGLTPQEQQRLEEALASGPLHPLNLGFEALLWAQGRAQDHP